MVTLRCTFPSGYRDTVQAGTYGEAFDKAAAAGFFRAMNNDGEVFYHVGGEWVYACQFKTMRAPSTTTRAQR